MHSRDNELSPPQLFHQWASYRASDILMPQPGRLQLVHRLQMPHSSCFCGHSATIAIIDHTYRGREEFRRAADKIGDANGKPLDLNKYVVPCAFNNIVSFFYGDLFTHDHPMRSKLHSLMNQAAAVLFVGQLSQQPLALTADDYLVGNINSFLMAGTFSTSMTLMWQMINFAKNPDTVQARVQREIDEVVGHERRPTWEDRKRMPYTMASVWEVERWKTPSALGVARECAEDVVVGDIFIPKGTIVLPNMWAVHNDHSLWKEPAKFYPERYLSEDGKSLLHKPQHYIPFSIGQRACAGETFAKMEIFLLITFLLQKYRVVAENPIEWDLNAPETELSNISHIKLRFLPRKLGKVQRND
ncbi:vitamin D 25-hydroxylase-like [Rhipicephalus sanguineus]|uniref:vitamin D 25-hydroxylase-like n=1 Tax=Rhipicephalus sanguineus TaxID=34632 RepID=UPI0020C1C2FC|nr:vitamin D 25-hydroxylase-like [Rhipicephalus sanguineus]